MARFLKPSGITLSIISFLIPTLVVPGLAQSGRGRPKVDQPSSATATPAKPVNIPATAAVVKQEQIGTSSRFVLRNGMTIVVNEHHATPIAAAVAYFKASPSDEPWTLNGAAELLERLIFKGTILRPAEHAVADLRALGASMEGDTAYDGASYSLVAPSDKIKEALTIQADMLQNASLDGEEMSRQIPIVIEAQKRDGAFRQNAATVGSHAFTARTFEANRRLSTLTGNDDPARYSLARLVGLALTNGASVNIDALRSLTRNQLAEFYRSHYRPENLIIAVTGDVSTFNTLVEIQQLYGAFGVKPAAAEEKPKVPDVTKPKASPGRTPVAPPEKPASDTQEMPPVDNSPRLKISATAQQTGLRYAAERSDITQSIVSTGFHVPGAETKDGAAVEVLTALAGQGRASRLSRSLIEGQLIANRVEAKYLALSNSGLLVIQTWSATESKEGSSIDKVESALFKEVDRLRREIPSDGEMARARSLLEKKFADQTAVYLGRANALARAEASGAAFREMIDYRSRIRAVTGQDVQRVAAKYLTLDNTSVHEYESYSAAPRTFDSAAFAKTVTAWAPGFAQPVESGAAQTADPSLSLAPVAQGSERSPERQAMVESVEPLPIKDFSTLNGPRAFVREDHAQQVVSVAILFQGGRLIEDAATSGTTELMLRSMLYGTPRRTYAQITQELEQLGADVRVIVDRDFFGFMLSALSRNSERAVKLLRDAIEDPAFRPEDIARARLGQIAAIRDARDSSFERSRELLMQSLLPGHPYSLPPHGREEVVASLNAEKLTEWHMRAIKRQVPLAIIVGDTDGSALVSSQIAEGFKRRDVDASIQVRVPQPAKGEKSEQRRTDQSAIAVGFPGPKAESNDLTAAQLIESMMNGTGGRLVLELRDKQNLLWTGEIDHEAMFVTGVIAAYAGSRPENEQQAKGALLSELEKLARAGLSANDLASARLLANTSLLGQLQSQPQHALQYGRAVLYGRQPSEIDAFDEHASKVSAEDIKRVASSYLKTSAASASIVRGTPQQPAAAPPKQD